MKKGKGILTIALVLMMLTGCGKSTAMDSYSADMTTEMATEEAVDSYAATDQFYSADNGTNGVEPAEAESAAGAVEEGSTTAADSNASAAEGTEKATDRKLIRNVDMNIETQDYDNLIANIQARVDEYEGYMENVTYYGDNIQGNYGYDDNYDYAQPTSYYGSKSAVMSIRIPAARLDAFLKILADSSNITYQNESVTDITLQYVDVQSHRDALRAEEKRLTELMDMAESVEDLITIENSLTDVRYQLQNIESQLRVYDNQVDYSTVTLNISEVEVYTPETPKSAWEKISVGFVGSIRSIGRGLRDFAIWFVIHIPYLVIWAAIIAVAVLVIKKVKRVHRRKAESREKSEEARKEKIENNN